MSEQQWRVLDGSGNDVGPYSLQNIRDFHASGNITNESLVWSEGMPEWLPAGRIPGLLLEVQVPVVPLAKGTPAAATPPAQATPGAGINLSPQTNVAGTGVQTVKDTKKEKASGFTFVTAACGILVLVLFFMPWVSINMDIDGSKKVKIVTLYTQTGFQTVTKAYSISDDPIPGADEDQGMAEKPKEVNKPEPTKEPEDKTGELEESETGKDDAPAEDQLAEDDPEKAEEAVKPQEEKKSDSPAEKPTPKKIKVAGSVMVLLALIAVCLGTILAIIGIFKPVQMLTISGQLLFVVAAFLIGIQMALQFPMAKVVLNSQASVRESVQKFNEPLFKAYDAIGNGDLETAKEIAAKCKPKTKRLIQEALPASPAEITKLANELRQSEAQLEVPYGVSYGASCFIAVGVLAIFIFLAVITMSSESSTPLITPQGGFQMPSTGTPGQTQPGQPQQPQQPGSGLKFH